MKLSKIVKLCPVFAFLTASAFAANATDGIVKISVANTLDIDRNDEIVSVDLPSLGRLPENFIVRDSSGAEIPYQLTYDNKLIFPVSLSARSKKTYAVEPGTPAPADTVAYGRFFPERLDDFAWENDIAAYRYYGPAFQARGSVGYGYDIWTKSVSYPVIETRYHNEVNRIHSYHVDDGTGMDVYDVGPSLGAGGTALTDAGKFIYPRCFEKYEVLDNGPLRLTVRFHMYPNTYDGKTINETRTISLDKGAYFNRTEVVYDTDATPESVIAGISVKEAASDAYSVNPKLGFVTYGDPTNKPEAGNGIIYIALIADKAADAKAKMIPTPEKQGATVGHVCLDYRYRPGTAYRYYWGGSWSKRGIDSLDAWNRLVETRARTLRTPLVVKVNAR